MSRDLPYRDYLKESIKAGFRGFSGPLFSFGQLKKLWTEKWSMPENDFAQCAEYCKICPGPWTLLLHGLLSQHARISPFQALVGIACYALPSILIMAMILIIESMLPVSWSISTYYLFIKSSMYSAVIGLIMWACFRLIYDVFPKGLECRSRGFRRRYVLLSPLIAATLYVLMEWNALSVLLICALYPIVHAQADKWVSRLQLSLWAIAASVFFSIWTLWGSDFRPFAHFIEEYHLKNFLLTQNQMMDGLLYASLLPGSIAFAMLHWSYQLASWSAFWVAAVSIVAAVWSSSCFFHQLKTRIAKHRDSTFVLLQSGIFPAIAIILLWALWNTPRPLFSDHMSIGLSLLCAVLAARSWPAWSIVAIGGLSGLLRIYFWG